MSVVGREGAHRIVTETKPQFPFCEYQCPISFVPKPTLTTPYGQHSLGLLKVTLGFQSNVLSTLSRAAILDDYELDFEIRTQEQQPSTSSGVTVSKVIQQDIRKFIEVNTAIKANFDSVISGLKGSKDTKSQRAELKELRQVRAIKLYL